ncbi:MAG: rhomboid family intramembrane serine protease [Desulfonatronovibrionaceae bacterium]
MNIKDLGLPRREAVDITARAEKNGFKGRDRIAEWSLVLEAMGIPYELDSGRIMVDPVSASRALENILAYERENVSFGENEPLDAPLPWTGNLLVLGCLLVFFSLTRAQTDLPGVQDIAWTESGATDSRAILSGQWWLGLTSLTLHADPAHALGNVVFGAPFVVLVCSRLGNGLGWAGIIFSGWLGNMVNAWIRGPGHLSIGFSTAVFAAAGIMVSVHRNRRGLKNSVDAVVMALALLALLGTGGENTDLGAHFWGTAAGFACGSVLRFQPLPLPPSRAISALFGTGAGFFVLLAWDLALNQTG